MGKGGFRGFFFLPGFVSPDVGGISVIVVPFFKHKGWTVNMQVLLTRISVVNVWWLQQTVTKITAKWNKVYLMTQFDESALFIGFDFRAAQRLDMNLASQCPECQTKSWTCVLCSVLMSPQASVRLTLATLLYSGKSTDGHHILVNVPAAPRETEVYPESLWSPLHFTLVCVWSQSSAKYLHKELPVRIAHRIKGFRSLPFIIGCNPTILQVVRTHTHTHTSLPVVVVKHNDAQHKEEEAFAVGSKIRRLQLGSCTGGMRPDFETKRRETLLYGVFRLAGDEIPELPVLLPPTETMDTNGNQRRSA